MSVRKGSSSDLRSLVLSLVFVGLISGGGRAFAEPPSAITDLGWMSGHWTGSALGGEVEEHWTEPADGTMTGMFRLRSGGKTRVVEYLMITEEADAVIFRFKHFGTDFEPWEKDRPLIFEWVRGTDREAVFESSVQDRPKRMTYRRDGDVLTVTVEGVENGETSSFDVQMRLAGSDDDSSTAAKP